MTLVDFIYYNSIGATTLAIGFLTLEYLSDPSNFIPNMRSYSLNALYWGMDKVITLRLLYTTHIKPLVENIGLGKEYDGIEMFNLSDRYARYYGSDFENNKIYCIRSVEKNGKVYKETMYYDHLNDSIYSTIQESKPYLGIELIYNDTSYDVFDILKPYHICGNIIDKDVIRIIMIHILKLQIVDYENIRYTLKIFKKDSSQAQLDETKNIEFIEDSYEIYEEDTNEDTEEDAEEDVNEDDSADDEVDEEEHDDEADEEQVTKEE
jgi:hypothetical protein